MTSHPIQCPLCDASLEGIEDGAGGATVPDHRTRYGFDRCDGSGGSVALNSGADLAPTAEPLPAPRERPA